MTQKILIVDDEKDLVLIMVMKLQAQGYEIEIAYDGKEV